MIAVVGPNGAGKSTLFKGVVGLLKPLAGHIDRGGLVPRDLAYLPQVAEIDRTFPINVYDMVAMGLWRHAGLFGSVDRAARDKIEAAIGTVGLSGFEERAISTLSGGQMQRMLFARLLLQDSPGDGARRAVQRHRRQDRGRPRGAGRALACRQAHRACGAARPRACARAFPGDAAARARARGLGPHRRCADRREPPEGAPDVRGIRQQRRRVRAGGADDARCSTNS